MVLGKRYKTPPSVTKRVVETSVWGEELKRLYTRTSPRAFSSTNCDPVASNSSPTVRENVRYSTGTTPWAAKVLLTDVSSATTRSSTVIVSIRGVTVIVTRAKTVEKTTIKITVTAHPLMIPSRSKRR